MVVDGAAVLGTGIAVVSAFGLAGIGAAVAVGVAGAGLAAYVITRGKSASLIKKRDNFSKELIRIRRNIAVPSSRLTLVKTEEEAGEARREFGRWKAECQGVIEKAMGPNEAYAFAEKSVSLAQYDFKNEKSKLVA